MPSTSPASLGFGATAKWNSPVSFKRTQVKSQSLAALTNGEFRRQSSVVKREQYSPEDNESLQQAINASYRQVFGNAHIMEFERSSELEAQLRNGDINIQNFIRGLAKSSLYKSRFFDSVSPQRGIELIFKHLLGRPPRAQYEVSECISILADSGHDAVVDSLIESPEYAEVFGEDIVPYARAWSSPNFSTASFPNMAELERSFVVSDSAIGGRSLLQRNLAKNIVQSIRVPTQVHGGTTSLTGSYARAAFAPRPTRVSDGGDSTPIRGDAYVGFGLGQREQEVFERYPGVDSSEQITGLIYACYRQVMGNPHLMEFERSLSAESRYRDGFASTREFVRAIGLSPEYRRRFFEANAPYRFIELNFKHFLGRAPRAQAEISEHTQILAERGYEAEISSYVDSNEYQEIFGENTIPYMRVLSERGRSQIAFNLHLSLAEGYAASDSVLTGSSLVNSVAASIVPNGWSKVTSRINRSSTQSGVSDPTLKRFRIVVKAQKPGLRQRSSNSTYLVTSKGMSSQIKYIHARGGRIASITEVM